MKSRRIFVRSELLEAIGSDEISDNHGSPTSLDC